MKKSTITIVAILTTLITAPYVAAGWNEKPVDDAFRAQAPGQFVQLTDGMIHYRWLGDPNGEIVVLVHGVSVPQYVFAQAGDALVESGYRVLLFDHFGHGYSDRPVASYDAGFFAQQMIEVFDGLELDEPVHVGALSMGGIIAIDFTARHPERVKSLTLFAPAGLRLVNTSDSVVVKVLKAPVIGNWLWRIVARGFYYPDDKGEAPKVTVDSGEKLQGIPKEQADYEGYLMAQRQIFRNLTMSHGDHLLKEIDKSSVPVLGIFGDADGTISIESAELLAELIPGARVEVLEGATHHLNIHRWRDIHNIMLSFLQENAANSGSAATATE